MFSVLERLNPFALHDEHVRETHMTYVRHAGEWAWRYLARYYHRSKPAVPFETMVVGQEVTHEFKTSWWSTWYFAFCTGDFNRAHFGSGVPPFTGPIVHGMHLASYISNELGMELPGQGTIFSRMNNMAWHAPVYIGERVTVTLKITRLEPKNKPHGFNRITFAATIHTEAGTLAVEAEPIAYVQ